MCGSFPSVFQRDSTVLLRHILCGCCICHHPLLLLKKTNKKSGGVSAVHFKKSSLFRRNIQSETEKARNFNLLLFRQISNLKIPRPNMLTVLKPQIGRRPPCNQSLILIACPNPTCKRGLPICGRPLLPLKPTMIAYMHQSP